MILYSKLKQPSDYSYKVILIWLSYISCCLKSLNQKELSQRLGHVLGSFKRARMARLCCSAQFFFFFFFFTPNGRSTSSFLNLSQKKSCKGRTLDRLVHLPHLCLVYVKRILKGKTVRIRRSTKSDLSICSLTQSV